MDDYIAKPVDARRLLDAVASRLAPASRPLFSERELTSPSLPLVADLPRAMGRLLGSRLLLAKLIETFVESAPQARSKLGDAIAQRDASAVAFATHRLRGQAATFDAARLIRVIEEVESESRHGRWDRVDDAFANMSGRLEELLRALADAETA